MSKKTSNYNSGVSLGVTEVKKQVNTRKSEYTVSEQDMRNELGRFMEGNNGCPKRYASQEALIDEVMKYLTICNDQKRVPTMTGLALALGFRNRTSIVAYQKEPGYEFAYDILAFAKMQIESYLEERLLDPKNNNIAGLIFNLKNNFNWVDKQEVKIDQKTMQLTGFKMIRNDGQDSGDQTE